MYACLFNSWSGSQLDTIISIEPSYIEVDNEKVDGVLFVAAGSNTFDWFVPLDANDIDGFILSIANIHPNTIDAREWKALHIDEDENVDKDEWAWYTGKPAKKGFLDGVADIAGR